MSIPKVSKVAIKNIINSVSLHNRFVEEEECWRQRRIELSERVDAQRMSRRKSPSRNFLKKSTRDSSRNTIDMHYNNAHMDCDDDVQPCVYEGREAAANHFLKLYDKVESTCPDRWGHNGYKELYPELFVSDDEDEHDVSDDSTNKKLKKEKHKHKKSKKKKSKRDSSIESTSGAEKSRKRKRHSSPSDTEGKERRKKKLKKAHCHHSSSKKSKTK